MHLCVHNTKVYLKYKLNYVVLAGKAGTVSLSTVKADIRTLTTVTIKMPLTV